MTKKDYQMIAGWIASMRSGVEQHGNIVLKSTFPQFVERIANDLHADNPRFDRAKFLTACGLDN